MLEMFAGDGHRLYKSYNTRKQKTFTFGSIKLWKKYQNGKISIENFHKNRDSVPLLFIGASNRKGGNKKFKLNIDETSVVFKQSKDNHHKLLLKTTNSRLKMLKKLQSYEEEYTTPITYRLSQEYIYITFDECILNENKHSSITNRIGSLDLNPNYVAFTIQDFDKNNHPIIVYRQIFNISPINKTHISEKIKHELLEVSKCISKSATHYGVDIVGIEKLEIRPKNHNKGRFLNRLINTTWKKDFFVKNLKKRLNILGIKHQDIACTYSSTIGCLMNPNETDSIAAALEIGRRTYMFSQKYLKKNIKFLDKDIIYPTLDYKLIQERWNSILSDYNPKRVGWVGIHNYLKEKKKLTELRFLFKDYDFSSWSCFRHKSDKSLVLSCCC
jgi:hypothetical protein